MADVYVALWVGINAEGQIVREAQHTITAEEYNPKMGESLEQRVAKVPYENVVKGIDRTLNWKLWAAAKGSDVAELPQIYSGVPGVIRDELLGGG